LTRIPTGFKLGALMEAQAGACTTGRNLTLSAHGF